MSPDDLKMILAEHWKWIQGEQGGKRANLSGANLSRANLSRANLSGANLSRANLSRANLYGANLYEANLFGANLSGADLDEANLSGANLSRANLSRADLYGANLSRADLPREMTIQEWCDAHDLATLPNGHRVAFKRLPKSLTTGEEYGLTVKWSRGKYVEAADWNGAQKCGGGLHLSPTPQMTRIYSDGELCLPVSFNVADAVHIGDKLKVRKCRVL